MSSPEYCQQLEEKKIRLSQLFSDIAVPRIEVFASPEQYFRMRAEFRLWHEDEDIFYAMFARGEKPSSASMIRVDHFPTAHESINNMMSRLLAAIANNLCLTNRLFQVEFLSTLSGEMLITLIYRAPLDEVWRIEAEKLARELDVYIIGRSRGQKVVLSQDYVTEKLTVHGREFSYRQIEGGFTQPNAYVCRDMLEWACSAAKGLGGDLLELYCGNGNFTLPLSTHFKRVLATELSKTSVYAAQENIAANGADNIDIVRLSAQEFTEAYSAVREFHRLQQQKIYLTDYEFSTVFVDPPRAGIDNETLKLLQGFENIIYISCNPETLRANLDTLTQTHSIQRFALFDQFPFTHHIESGVLLIKK
ncbi:MAG: tRNA (uridine(54)-C5)-methyltransferase TrmA [Neisseria sp.]